MNNSNGINDISDMLVPGNYQKSIDVRSKNKSELLRDLRLMLLIRLSEQCLAVGRKNGDIGGPVHLGVGQEAIATGVSASLFNTDRVFGAHRSHSHAIAQGVDIHGLFSEVLGKEDGLSKGMGGSMHLWDQPNGFYGSVPIVSGTVSLAVGAGLAAKFEKSNDISVVYLGDGAVEEGTVHESLNLASITGIPVLFVVENNAFASHMHINKRQPFNSTARFAIANKIKSKIVDGNDIISTREAASQLIQYCRKEKKPVFLEAITYRWYGHVDWREDIDVGVNRSKQDLIEWKKRDPIKRLVDGMCEAEMLDSKELKDIESLVKTEVESAWKSALQAPYPEESALLGRVYSGIKK